MPLPCDVSIAGFEGYAPLKLSIVKSGANILIYAENKSKSIIHVKRMIICGQWDSSATFLYRRKSDFVISDQIEQGTMYLMCSVGWSNAKKVQVEAEYIEFTGRALSKCVQF
jgi:hypothetical protein